MAKKIVKASRLIMGGIASDNRGQVSFNNDFHFDGIKRFYMIENAHTGLVRAWHGHKREGKFVLVVQGAALLGTVSIDNWKVPSRDSKVQRFIINSKMPAILCVPPGSAIGLQSLTKNTKILIFSDRTLKQSEDDDIRFAPDYWRLRPKKFNKLETAEITED